MKKIIIIVIALIFIGGAGFAWERSRSDDDSGTSNQTAQPRPEEDETEPTEPDQAGDMVEVDIQDFAFQPASLTIAAGTTVTWTNQDDAQHDITPDEEGAGFARSQLLSKGESYSFTFDTPGTYTYHCTPHPNMTGTITVTE